MANTIYLEEVVMLKLSGPITEAEHVTMLDVILDKAIYEKNSFELTVIVDDTLVVDITKLAGDKDLAIEYTLPLPNDMSGYILKKG